MKLEDNSPERHDRPASLCSPLVPDAAGVGAAASSSSQMVEEALQQALHRRTMGRIIGTAPAFARAVERLSDIASSEAAVLVDGETGTGKELIARAIHYMSHRAGGPFVPVNCGSLVESLMEDELFGHERGAFTDARDSRPGLVAAANGGTLFLDEVDALSPKAQVALLRVLQDKRYRPVGSSAEREAVVRVVTATNASLERNIAAGLFRADLYYRLCIFKIKLPPLRERQQDILPLARFFLEKHTSSANLPKLSPGATVALVASHWPGNVRELENAIIRGSHLCRGGCIQAEDLGLPLHTRPGSDASSSEPSRAGLVSGFNEEKRLIIQNFERDYLIRLMSTHAGNVSRAAETAGKERRDLGRLLKKHCLNPRDFADGAARESGDRLAMDSQMSDTADRTGCVLPQVG